MEQQLLDKYGGRTINRSVIDSIIKDIKNYKEPTKDETEPNLNIDNILTKINTMKDGRGDDLTDKTKRNYKSKINAIEKIIPNIFQLFIDNPDNKPIINDALKQIRDEYPKSYKDYIIPLSKIIENIEGLSSKISSYIKGRIQQLIKEGNKVSVKISDEKVEFKPLKITWKEFTKKTRELQNNDEAPLQDKVLFQLYKLLTLRDNFGDVKLVEKDIENTDDNYYNVNTSILHLNQYKTIKKYGPKQYKLPKELSDDIKELFKEQNYLYVQIPPDTLYNRGELSKVVSKLSTKYYDTKFNITDIRNARISYSQDREPIDKQRQTADTMLHSLSTAQQVYNRKAK